MTQFIQQELLLQQAAGLSPEEVNEIRLALFQKEASEGISDEELETAYDQGVLTEEEYYMRSYSFEDMSPEEQAECNEWLHDATVNR